MYKTPIDHLLDNLERSAVVRGKVLLGMGLLQERSWEGGGYRSSNSLKRLQISLHTLHAASQTTR